MTRVAAVLGVARLLGLTMGALVATVSSAAAQQQPSGDPVLRVEADMHTATIRRAAADAAGRILITASEDKTLRIWSLATGALVRTVRVPLGDGDEGKLYAVAMSPDGKWAVAGGWTGYQWEQTHSLYVVEVASGRILNRIGGLPNVTNHLAWSADGRFIAAALGLQNGIRVYRTSDWQEVARDDTDYGAATYGAAFDRTGRLATASFDGFVRLYDVAFRRIAKVKAPGGNKPFSVAFSPDGARLAVGFDDAVAVDVLAVPGLQRQFAADVPRATSGNLCAVAWTVDGALLAAGRYDEGGGSPVLRWPGGGQGKRQTLPAADDTVMELLPLDSRGFVYVAADPAFGRYDAQGVRRLRQERPIADFRDQGDKLRLSPDGAEVAFGLKVFGARPASFSTERRRLDLGAVSGDLVPPETTALPITGWHESYDPKFAGKALKLDTDETSESVAIAPDKRSFALGTAFWLRRFAATGDEIWEKAIPGVAWDVNISRDGRLLVAAFGDGTIRWYRYGDGRELLALFVHKDGKRWVLWTPEGYYDAAPGAEDLIGWHVNRGLDHEADFFPASRFRDRFYKPEVTSAVLRTLDIDAALKEAQTSAAPPITTDSLPPVIKILSPAEGAAVTASPAQLRYLVRSPSGDRVNAIEVRVDGRPLAGDEGLVKLANGPATPQGEQEGSIAVRLDHDATVTLIARAGERQSEAANLRLAWKPPAAPPAPTVPKPKLYVLAIGVSKYADTSIELRYAAKDAGDLAAALKRQEGKLYREVEVRVLPDGKATRGAIYDGLDWIKRETTQRDVAIVFLSGHGVRDPDDESTYYFLPADVDLDRLHATGVPQLELRASLRRISGKALFFFDTCHSGFAIGGPGSGTKGLPPDINGVVNDLVGAENGVVVFAASTGRELAQERAEWGNGAFTKALIEALTGKSDAFRDDVVTISMLEYWLAERVKTLTDGKQHPTSVKPDSIRDFPIAVVVH